MPNGRSPIPPPRSSGFTATTGSPLYWCSYGPADARRILVLHGGPGAHHDYLLPQFLDLADTFELIFYDQRGGGRSKTDERAPITWQVHVHDLECVISELRLSPATIIGYSWGGLLALLYAIEAAGTRVTPPPARLALIDPAPLTTSFRAQFETEFARRQQGPEIARLREELGASGLRESDPDAWRQRQFELSVAGYFADPMQARRLTPFRVTGRVQQAVWQSLGEFDLMRDLRVVRCPTLIVHGEQDPIPIASSREAAAAMNAEFVALDACGHVPYVEARAAVFAVLRSFLQRTPDSFTP